MPACLTLPPRLSGFGGKGIRTPDFQLAKLALYQLSYAPAGIAECRFRISIADFRLQGNKSKMPDVRARDRHPARVVSLNFIYCETGTAKYAVNTPVIGSTALPVISPLLFMSFASARTAE